jgi:hypothetical protein
VSLERVSRTREKEVDRIDESSIEIEQYGDRAVPHHRKSTSTLRLSDFSTNSPG